MSSQTGCASTEAHNVSNNLSELSSSPLGPLHLETLLILHKVSITTNHKNSYQLNHIRTPKLEGK
jgi:hypothetical protein